MKKLTRVSALMTALGLSRQVVADVLRVDPTTVSRLANGQPEPGPVSVLLDQVAMARGRADLTLAVFGATAEAAGGERSS